MHSSSDALNTLGLKLLGQLAHDLVRSGKQSAELGDDAK